MTIREENVTGKMFVSFEKYYTVNEMNNEIISNTHVPSR